MFDALIWIKCKVRLHRLCLAWLPIMDVVHDGCQYDWIIKRSHVKEYFINYLKMEKKIKVYSIAASLPGFVTSIVDIDIDIDIPKYENIG